MLARRVRLLVAATITYNVVEAVVGFGLDSVIEVSSAAAVAWQFAAPDPQAREKVALRVIAVSFFALAAYVTVEPVRALVGGADAEHSSIGLVLTSLSLAIMPVLSYAQRRAGRELGSRSAVADSKQTLLCTYLSAVLLVGLGVNSLFGWSWADPVAALVIAAVAVKEGREAWRGDTCCAVPLTALSPAPAPQPVGRALIRVSPADAAQAAPAARRTRHDCVDPGAADAARGAGRVRRRAGHRVNRDRPGHLVAGR